MKRKLLYLATTAILLILKAPVSNAAEVRESIPHALMPSTAKGAFLTTVGITSCETFLMALPDKNPDSSFIEFEPDIEVYQLEEVEIIENSRTGRQDPGSINLMDKEQLRRIPQLLGEQDIIRSLQSTPGVHMVCEGLTGISVRGGNPSQNRYLLDGIPVISPNHLMGFFSAFNPDIVKGTTLYKGYFPAGMGGASSALISINTAMPDMQRFRAAGAVGLISSRLALEIPLLKNRWAVMLSGRRSYADIFAPLLLEDGLKSSKLYFYDLNFKSVGNIGHKSQLIVNGYWGGDSFRNHYAYEKIENQYGSICLKSWLSENLSVASMIYFTGHGYALGTIDKDMPNSFIWRANLLDLGFKHEWDWTPAGRFSLMIGFETVYHHLSPGEIKGIGNGNLIKEFKLEQRTALESGIHAEAILPLSKGIVLHLGTRVSSFGNLERNLLFDPHNENDRYDTVHDHSGLYRDFQWNIEPRLKLVVRAGNKGAFKVMFNRAFQYVQQATSSMAGSPMDIWFFAGKNIAPQSSDQLTLGYEISPGKRISLGTEIYYKILNNVIEFREHASAILNERIEDDLIPGKGTAYGMEFFFSYDSPIFKSWMNYTWSRSFREVGGIRQGRPYASWYDVPHDLNLNLTFILKKRIELSANWTYSSGKLFNIPTGKGIVSGTAVPIYESLNLQRIMDYHRLDLALKILPRDNKSHYRGEWTFSVYNAYNRKNIWSLRISPSDTDPDMLRFENLYLFGIVPSVSYQFKF